MYLVVSIREAVIVVCVMLTHLLYVWDCNKDKKLVLIRLRGFISWCFKNYDFSPLTDSNAQRKILEDLQLKKQMILKQGVSQALSAPATSQQPTVSNYEYLLQLR